MSNLKFSVVGCGSWGQNLIRNFSDLGALHSVCDSKPDLAFDVSQIYDVPAYSLDKILSSDCDGVVISASASQHFSLASQALTAGKHVFVEKPISLRLDHAKELRDLALLAGRTLMVGHLLQYHPAFLALKELVREGALGQLSYIYSNRLNLGRFRHEETALWCLAPHDTSMILSLVGELPESVHATGTSHLNPPIHDTIILHMTFKNGLQAHIFASWFHPFKEQRLVLVGDRGMAVFDDGLPWEEKLTVYSHQVIWKDGLPHPEKASAVSIPLEPSEPLKIECQHFIDSIRSNRSPRTDADESLLVLRVLEAAESSLHSHVPISLLSTAFPSAEENQPTPKRVGSL